jgi:RND superfamily putative drug exporter
LGVLDRAGRDEAATAIADQLHGLAADLPPGAKIEVGGPPVLSLQTRDAVQEDLRDAEVTSLPVTLIVLVLVFGGVVAAGLPVVAAVVSVAAAMGVMLGFSAFTDIDQDGVTVVTLLGLGLSVDYGLLLVARYREELMRGFAPDIAVARAWATAGRTIAFSGLTVAAALTGLLLFDLPTLTALGAAGVSIAVVCMLVSLTLTAALIGGLQRWIRPSKHRRRLRLAAKVTAPAAVATGLRAITSRPSPPPQHLSAPDSDDDDDGLFARLSLIVQQRPLLVLLGTLAALLLATAPLLGSELRLPGLDGVPRSIESARVADALSDRFGRPANPPVTVVARTDATTLEAWAAKWHSDPAVKEIRPVRAVRAFPTDLLSTVSFEVTGGRQDAETRALVDRMRASRPQGMESWVTGDAAVLTDLLGLINGRLPLAIIGTILAMMALLFAMTGSLVIPAKAILANLVSLGATFGVLTAVFGYGFGSALLSTLTTGALNPFVVVVIFAFAFGLSMDYEVFLLARIKEFADSGMDTETAVRRGLQHSGRVITSAALLMVIVFGCFAAARIGNVEQIGLGLTVAVAIDATIVRCLLVPATMTLLGRWNWWAPEPLVRLHEQWGLRERPLPELEPEERPSVLSAHARAALHAAPTRAALPAAPAAMSEDASKPSLADLYRSADF